LHVKNKPGTLGMQFSLISSSQFSPGLRLYQSHSDISLVTISRSVSRLINAEEMRARETERCDSKNKCVTSTLSGQPKVSVGH